MEIEQKKIAEVCVKSRIFLDSDKEGEDNINIKGEINVKVKLSA